MRLLPDEGRESSPRQSASPNARHKRGRNSQAFLRGGRPSAYPKRNPKLASCTIAVKKLSRRLDQYADHGLGEKEVLHLLEDTRSQVISLHIARKQLKKNSPRRHRDKNSRGRF